MARPIGRDPAVAVRSPKLRNTPPFHAQDDVGIDDQIVGVVLINAVAAAGGALGIVPSWLPVPPQTTL